MIRFNTLAQPRHENEAAWLAPVTAVVDRGGILVPVAGRPGRDDRGAAQFRRPEQLARATWDGFCGVPIPRRLC